MQAVFYHYVKGKPPSGRLATRLNTIWRKFNPRKSGGDAEAVDEDEDADDPAELYDDMDADLLFLQCNTEKKRDVLLKWTATTAIRAKRIKSGAEQYTKYPAMMLFSKYVQTLVNMIFLYKEKIIKESGV